MVRSGVVKLLRRDWGKRCCLDGTVGKEGSRQKVVDRRGWVDRRGLGVFKPVKEIFSWAQLENKEKPFGCLKGVMKSDNVVVRRQRLMDSRLSN